MPSPSDELCKKSATELARLLERGEVSSEELTRAHLTRIDACDDRLRAFTAVFRDEALASARRADEERGRGDVRSSLHGLPMSVKESIDFAGHAATMGVHARRSLIAKTDGGMLQAARSAGAVILGRTNVSQFLFFHESRNPLFGETKNPFSLAHTPGGSSGGEAAAIAAGMSPLGFGTDIGGSIRVPAHFTGICGLKPTLDFWTNKGSNTALAGQEAVRGQIGPMARTVADLVMAMTALDPRQLSRIDPRVPPITFSDPSSIEVPKLRVGVLVDDGWVRPSAAVARAVHRAAEALRTRGCSIVPFTPPGTDAAIEHYFAALSADGGETIARGLGDGPIDPVLEGLRRLTKIPPRVRLMIARTLELLGDEKLARILRVTQRKTVAELYQVTDFIRRYRGTFLGAMDAAELDVLLVPAHATTALPHGMAKDFPVAGSPSMLYNLLQFPGGVVPVTRVREAETARPGARGKLEKHAAKVDAESARLPVGVQVVGRPWADHVVLAAMAAIEAEVRTDSEFPRTPVELA